MARVGSRYAAALQRIEIRLSRRYERAATGSARTRLVALASMATMLTACASPGRSVSVHTPTWTCPAPLEPYLRAALYMSGRNTDGLADDRWEQLVNEVLIRHFPGGATVLETRGWWQRSNGGAATSAGRTIVILHPLAERDSFVEAVEMVIAEIKERFNHRSVLWEEARVCATF